MANETEFDSPLIPEWDDLGVEENDSAEPLDADAEEAEHGDD